MKKRESRRKQALLLFPTRLEKISTRARGEAWGSLGNLVKEAYAFRALDTVGRKWSSENYAGGYTSYSSISNIHEQSMQFGELKKWIDRQVASFAKAQHWDLGQGRLEMNTFWINIMGKLCHHSFHIHPLSVVSGTFYLQVPKGAGSFKVEDPRMDALMAAPPRTARAPLELARHVSVKPEAGALILFESWLRHEVPAHDGKDDRISVSFNYSWRE